jgi:hypothetical protein
MELVGDVDNQKWQYMADGLPPQDHFPKPGSSTFVIREEGKFKDSAFLRSTPRSFVDNFYPEKTEVQMWTSTVLKTAHCIHFGTRQ